MATVKKSKTTPVKAKAARKPKPPHRPQPKKLALADIDAIAGKVAEILRPSFGAAEIDAIAGKVAEILRPPGPGTRGADQEPLPATPVQGAAEMGRIKQVKAEPPKLHVEPSPEEIANWSPEQVAEYNQKQVQRLAKLKKDQANNRRDLEKLSTRERMAKMTTPQDPNDIRALIPLDYTGDGTDMVRVTCLRRVGLGGGRMSEINEQIDMPRDNARVMQKAGSVEVTI